jgi:riboflavin synthase
VFTGIVRERARVLSLEGGDLVVESRLEAETGDSVAVNGVCLTVTGREDGHLRFHVIPETTSRAKPFGAEVNLEPALRAERDGDDVRLRVEAPPEILRYCIEKGSIALDGVALTIAALDKETFEVALVPHTLAVTTLGELQPGDAVNLEADVLARYVERLALTR